QQYRSVFGVFLLYKRVTALASLEVLHLHSVALYFF
ncbi:MAG: hypothetical protein ACI9PD_002060, partial [Psychrobacter glaciei]